MSLFQRGKVAETVREIGDMQYSFVPGAPFGTATWMPSKIRPLQELWLPLYMLPSHGKVVLVGHALVSGVTIAEY
jgi:hypothetical protein